MCYRPGKYTVCRRVGPCIFQPGNFTGWSSEVVKTAPHCQSTSSELTANQHPATSLPINIQRAHCQSTSSEYSATDRPSDSFVFTWFCPLAPPPPPVPPPLLSLPSLSFLSPRQCKSHQRKLYRHCENFCCCWKIDRSSFSWKTTTTLVR